VSDELFREVDEEVRQDRFQNLWKRYGIYLVIVFVVIVGATVAFVLWRDAQESARQANSARFLEAVVAEQTERNAAIDQLREIAREGTPGYRFLASLREAALLADGGETGEAVIVFDAVAADEDFEPVYRNIARLLAVAHGMQNMSQGEVEERLAGLAADDSPFRITAREFLAVAAIRGGNPDRAAELLRANIADNEVSRAAQARAGELLATLDR
jgi:hypothetical protein